MADNFLPKACAKPENSEEENLESASDIKNDGYAPHDSSFTTQQSNLINCVSRSTLAREAETLTMSTATLPQTWKQLMNLLALSGKNRRTADVRSKGFSLLFSLSKQDFEDAMKNYPQAHALLKKKSQRVLNQDKKKAEEAKRKAQEEAEQAAADEARVSAASRSVTLAGLKPGAASIHQDDLDGDDAHDSDTLLNSLLGDLIEVLGDVDPRPKIADAVEQIVDLYRRPAESYATADIQSQLKRDRSYSLAADSKRPPSRHIAGPSDPNTIVLPDSDDNTELHTLTSDALVFLPSTQDSSSTKRSYSTESGNSSSLVVGVDDISNAPSTGNPRVFTTPDADVTPLTILNVAHVPGDPTKAGASWGPGRRAAGRRGQFVPLARMDSQTEMTHKGVGGVNGRRQVTRTSIAASAAQTGQATELHAAAGQTTPGRLFPCESKVGGPLFDLSGAAGYPAPDFASPHEISTIIEDVGDSLFSCCWIDTSIDERTLSIPTSDRIEPDDHTSVQPSTRHSNDAAETPARSVESANQTLSRIQQVKSPPAASWSEYIGVPYSLANRSSYQCEHGDKQTDFIVSSYDPSVAVDTYTHPSRSSSGSATSLSLDSNETTPVTTFIVDSHRRQQQQQGRASAFSYAESQPVDINRQSGVSNDRPPVVPVTRTIDQSSAEQNNLTHGRTDVGAEGVISSDGENASLIADTEQNRDWIDRFSIRPEFGGRIGKRASHAFERFLRWRKLEDP